MDAFKLNADIHRTKIEVIFTDLKVALEFAELAATSENPDARNSNSAHAHKPCFEIRDKLLLCNPNASERVEIAEKLDKLRRSLERLGQKIF